jgi:N-acetylglutamate synthase-like GNAT family acetyltransferase
MKSVTPLFHFLKLRPLALLLWTAIATGIFKYRKTNLGSYLEILTVMAGAVIVAQGVLFLTLLYEASTTAPGHLGVGQLEVFGDQDLKEEIGAASGSSTGGVKKRTAAAAATTATTTSSEADEIVKGGSLAGKDNKFFVLEKSNRVIGCIGAKVDRSKSEAVITPWAVNTDDQRRGAGTLLLKTLMDSISESAKKEKVQVVRVRLQGYQVPALRLFHKFGFVQTDRTPEWMGERVTLEMNVKDWGKNLTKAQELDRAQKQE